MRQFRWLSEKAIPWRYDLRRCGWALCAPKEGAPNSHPTLIDDLAIASEVHGMLERATTIIIGVNDSQLRAHVLVQGFGEVVNSTVSLGELEQRTHRLSRVLETVPRRRAFGPLELDLLLRDGIVNGRRLGLHPREFGLLWRLAQAPGQPVPPPDLLHEVWRMNFKPETNSLAGHVCRLRAKLASAGLAGIICTMADGAYALSPELARTQHTALPLADRIPMLDDYLRQGETSVRIMQHETPNTAE